MIASIEEGAAARKILKPLGLCDNAASWPRPLSQSELWPTGL